MSEREKILQEKIQELETRLHNKSLEIENLKSSFFAHFSHEIRTPMNSILGFSTLLLENKNLPDTCFEQARQVYQGAQVLMNFFENIILYTAIQNDNCSVVPGWFDLRAFLNELQIIFRNYYRSRYVKEDILSISLISFDVSKINADREKLLLLILNALVLAYKHSPQEPLNLIVRVMDGHLMLKLNTASKDLFLNYYSENKDFRFQVIEKILRVLSGQMDIEFTTSEKMKIVMEIPLEIEDRKEFSDEKSQDIESKMQKQHRVRTPESESVNN